MLVSGLGTTSADLMPFLYALGAGGAWDGLTAFHMGLHNDDALAGTIRESGLFTRQVRFN